jgi:hypothetical protein
MPNASFKCESFSIFCLYQENRGKRAVSATISKWLGRWSICIVFGVIATIMFTALVPNGVATITDNRTLAPKILDEYYLTWSAEDARQLYAVLGATGRRAYQLFYLKLDFWFPVMSLSLFYASLLSLAFPQGTRLSRLNLLTIPMYLSDMGENLNHFMMAGSYPDLPAWQLGIGPFISLIKYLLITVLPVLALFGFWANRRSKGGAL